MIKSTCGRGDGTGFGASVEDFGAPGIENGASNFPPYFHPSLLPAIFVKCYFPPFLRPAAAGRRPPAIRNGNAVAVNHESRDISLSP